MTDILGLLLVVVLKQGLTVWHRLAKASKILLLQTLLWWDYRCAPPHPARHINLQFFKLLESSEGVLERPGEEYVGF